MPYNRPTLTELRQRNISYMESELDGAGSLLRFSNMRILAKVDAGMAHMHYGYLDWIAQQAIPATATDEYLAMWGALKSKYLKSATAAVCSNVSFEGTSGDTISAGTVLNRADGYQYTVDSDVSLGSSGTATGSITAVLKDASVDATCGGADGNADAGTILSFDQEISGVTSTVTCVSAITGGVDVETEDDFRKRVLLAFQNTPQGGSNADYESWALDVSGVTRAWTYPRLFGAGTVGVYIMCDGETTDNSGVPSGTDGVATNETYTGAKATGDQLSVANYIFGLRPVTASVYVCSPIKKAINFIIDGISDAASDTVAAIKEAISGVFFDNADLSPTGGTIYLSDIIIAVSAVSNTNGFVITSPSGNISLGTGEIPVLGTITFTGSSS